MSYEGKHNKKKNINGLKKSVMLLAAMMLIFTVSVGATLAYIVDTQGPLTNIFKPSEVACEVVENFNGTTKSDVKIQNIGDTDAYIRTYVVVTWKNSTGDVYGTAPVAGTDYEITWGSGWDRDTTDGFYYWPSPVTANGGQTGTLITSCTANSANAPENYNLSVEIIAEAIQSVPTSVVADKWGVTVSGTTISK